MAEPQPSTAQAGSTDLDEQETPAVPKSAEDRKAAAALSSLDAHNDDDASHKQEVDQEALGKAIRDLEIGTKSVGQKKEGSAAAAEKAEKEKEEERRRKIKVDQADVGLLVEELELSKAKATDLLKAHEGDAVKAMRAWVTASA
ncbi:MAG: hypothetical protein M1827_001956 [Pycnora praestabilis]|nr:MAG: hypothetical protein M1827_001956 [Pycnora praestabilis]